MRDARIAGTRPAMAPVETAAATPPTQAANDPEVRPLMDELDADRLRRMTANVAPAAGGGPRASRVLALRDRGRPLDVQLAGALRTAGDPAALAARAVRSLRRRRDRQPVVLDDGG